MIILPLVFKNNGVTSSINSSINFPTLAVFCNLPKLVPSNNFYECQSKKTKANIDKFRSDRNYFTGHCNKHRILTKVMVMF